MDNDTETQSYNKSPVRIIKRVTTATQNNMDESQNSMLSGKS